MITVGAVALVLGVLGVVVSPSLRAGGPVEIREYQGKKLSDFDRAYDNSIAGPQTVDPKTYRLEIGGLVKTPKSLTYAEVLALPPAKRVITLHCVEGWDETLLFEGVRLADLLALAVPVPKAAWVVFTAADGYTSAMKLDVVRTRDMMLAAKINGRVLDAKRGFPFQVVAEEKYGYKWVKWVKKIELVEKEVLGYWEKAGYDNDAEVGR